VPLLEAPVRTRPAASGPRRTERGRHAGGWRAEARRVRSRPEQRPDVEGLRAVAVLAVVLYHADLGPTGGGYVGVDVFLVVSGFLITGLLRRELTATGRIDLAAFYARRARRLLPAAALVLASTVLVSAWVLSPLQAGRVAGDARAAALYALNLRLAAQQADYLAAHDQPSPLLHFWSLGVEEQYYLLWPALLLLVVRLARPRRQDRALALTAAVVSAASLAACLHLTAVAQPWAFFSLPARAWELGLGALVAVVAHRSGPPPRAAATALGWLGLLAVVLAVVMLGGTTAFPGPWALLPVAGTAAVLLAGGRGGVGRLLGTPPARLVGRLSYSWYLWHWPVLVLAPEVLERPLTAAERLGAVLGAAVAAALTTRLVEDPLRFSVRARRPRTGLTLGAGLTALAVGVAIGTAHTLPRLEGGRAVVLAALPEAVRVPTVATPNSAGAPTPAPAPPPPADPLAEALAASVGVRALPANLEPRLAAVDGDRPLVFQDDCHQGFTGTRVASCTYGDPDAPTNVVLLGDSHAAQWFPGLHQAADEHGWRLVSLTKTTCPPMPLEVFSTYLRRTYTECRTWRDRALRRIAEEQPDVVVVGVARHYGKGAYGFDVFGPEWHAGLASLTEQLRGTGAQVVVLGAKPMPPGSLPDCLARYRSDATRCGTAREDPVRLAGAAAEAQAVTRAGGRYVDVAPWLCGTSTCPPVVGNLLVHRDDNHLTTAYARWLAPVLAQAVAPEVSQPPLPSRVGSD